MSHHQGNPLRIVLVTTELKPGGAERCLVNLAIGLHARNHSVSVVSLMPQPPVNQNSLVSRLAESEIPVHFLNLMSVVSVPRAVFKLRRLLVTIKPDLVQSFLFHANVVSALASRFAGNLSHVAGIRVADPRTLRHRFERLLCRRTKKFVCVSKAVEEFSADVAGLPCEKLLTIPNGIDADHVSSAESVNLNELGVGPERRAIVYVGRLHEQKGLIGLFQNLPSLFDQAPDIELLMVGEGPSRGALESCAERLGFSGRVRFAGWRSDVPGILKSCEALVLPSQWEGMPNVVMEAMAVGRPVVAFNVHGVSELLGDDAGIQVCDPQNFQQLLGNVRRIVSDQSLALRLGEQNQRRITKLFSLCKMIDRYENLYKSFQKI